MLLRPTDIADSLLGHFIVFLFLVTSYITFSLFSYNVLSSRYYSSVITLCVLALLLFSHNFLCSQFISLQL